MHPLTRFFNYLKRIDFSLALAREHIDDRALTEWYPDWVYELMETDEVRNSAYRGAIQEAVAGRTVLELGTGRKALWAIYCARAGARKVYAIEANERAHRSSLAAVQAEGLRNVHLIRGFSDKVELPERCDLLVHDLIGDIGSSEGMIPFIEDAKRRLLTSEAIQIPRRCQTQVVLVEDPKLSPAEWALSYVLRGFASYETLSFVRFFGFPHAAALSEPQSFEDFRLAEPLALRSAERLEIEIKRDGELRGACFFIRLQLGETQVVDTWASQTSWSTPYVRLPAPCPVRRGEIIELSLQSELVPSPRYALALARRSGGSAREIGRYSWSGD